MKGYPHTPWRLVLLGVWCPQIHDDWPAQATVRAKGPDAVENRTYLKTGQG